MELPAIETLIRGSTVGIELLLAWLFWQQGRGFGVWRIAALFLLGTAAYVIVGSPVTAPHFSVAGHPLLFLATLNSVFFWWFATALFDDDFKWTFWRWIPFLGISLIFIVRYIRPDFKTGPLDNIVQQAIVIPMMLHALWMAIAHRNDDLLEYRRRFRLVFAISVGFLGLVIGIAEVLYELENPSAPLSFSHALILFGLTFALSAWMLTVKPIFAAHPVSSPSPASTCSPQDKLEIQSLQTLMETRYYREENLTIRKLAETTDIPEHRLRRLINQELGFRNFSTYLSSYRIEDAKRMLSDPTFARRQIIQIAFDLGYGSIAPFNRAFKESVGQTPSAYRTQTLGKKLD